MAPKKKFDHATKSAPPVNHEVINMPVHELIGHEKNARRHPADQVAKLAASIVAFGFTNPILIDLDGCVLAGHGRLAAAKSIGMTTVPVIRLNKGCCWCILVDNSMPLSWRGTTAHDIDFSLQVLTSGRCTALFSLYTVDKTATTTMKGGHSETVYKGDGRIHSARGLQKRWPQMIGLMRTAGMPRHVPIQGLWTKFNAEAVPQRGSDVGTSPLLAVSESGDK